MGAPTTQQKALAINLDPTQYGTFAEIGAGQEVARWFFRVGGAAGTIAETISAYDKQVSDARYGPCKRYVSRERLRAMLDHEYGRLQGELAAKRGDKTTYFVFADTGLPVLVSNFGRYFRLADYLGRHTAKPIAIALGLPTLADILDVRYYDDLQGGVLESFGRMFKSNVKLYVYPQRDERSGRTLTLDDVEAPGALRHLKAFLTETGRLQPIRDFNAGYLDVRAATVRAKIESGDSAWEGAVPSAVARTIKRDELFGYRAPS